MMTSANHVQTKFSNGLRGGIIILYLWLIFILIFEN